MALFNMLKVDRFLSDMVKWGSVFQISLSDNRSVERTGRLGNIHVVTG